jgi:hypothetical protein
MIGTIIGALLTGIMLTVIYFQYQELEEVYRERKTTTYEHVFFEGEQEGIRIVPSDRVIMRYEVTEKDWKELMKLVD